MGVQDQMPRGDDDFLKRLAAVEARATRTEGVSVGLASLQATRVQPQVSSASNLTYTLTTSYATYASFNVTVPPWATRALINAQGSVTALSSSAGSDNAYSRILINGSAGAEGRAQFSTSTCPSVPAFGASLLTGLTAGANILIEIQARLIFGPGVAPTGLLAGIPSASVTGSALFLS